MRWEGWGRRTYVQDGVWGLTNLMLLEEGITPDGRGWVRCPWLDGDEAEKEPRQTSLAAPPAGWRDRRSRHHEVVRDDEQEEKDES